VPKEDNGRVVTGKDGQPARTLKWDLSKIPHLKFGHYTANLLAAYDNGKQDVPLEASVSFWVVPWRLIILAVLIPTVPALLVYLIMRWRFNKRAGGDKHAKG
jgi:hypothetical protein